MTCDSLESGSRLWISATNPASACRCVYLSRHTYGVSDDFGSDGTGIQEVLGLFNMWIQLMLQMQNITWMVKFFLVVS